jgi:ATP-dependent DNA helicase PIF1
VFYATQVAILYKTNAIYVDPLKPKIMILAYTSKVSFNINGTTIHFALLILLKKKNNELKSLGDEKCDILIKTYDQLQMLVIDEISLVNNRMLTFIDYRLREIKQIHNKFMGGLDVIMIGDFYQATLVQDLWIFKSRINGLNILGTHLWQENIKLYE